MCDQTIATVAVIDFDPDQELVLVTRAKAGDRDALETLLRQQYDRVYAVCRRMTGHDADAADAAQEALMAMVRGLARFDERSRVSTWAYRIAVNASIDELRRRKRRPVPDLQDVSDRALSMGEAGRSDPDAVEDALDIDAAMRRLPVEFKAPVVLRDRCGLDYAEIAEVLGIPAGTVRSRIARGRAALVQILGPARSES